LKKTPDPIHSWDQVFLIKGGFLERQSHPFHNKIAVFFEKMLVVFLHFVILKIRYRKNQIR